MHRLRADTATHPRALWARQAAGLSPRSSPRFFFDTALYNLIHLPSLHPFSIQRSKLQNQTQSDPIQAKRTPAARSKTAFLALLPPTEQSHHSSSSR